MFLLLRLSLPGGPLLPTARIYSSWETDPRADVVSAAGVSLGCCLPQVHSGDISLPHGGKDIKPPFIHIPAPGWQKLGHQQL